MLFSDYYKIKIGTGDDWFDPILSSDTKLFIDPLLVTDTNHKHFTNVSKKISDFFAEGFRLAANSSPHPNDNLYILLLSMMKFPEVQEICLGYSESTEGAGASDGFGEKIVSAIYQTISMGLKNIHRFETLGLFNKGIGKDRLSDITANIIKENLIKYTEKIAKKHKLKTKQFFFKQVNFNLTSKRWMSGVFELPENPYSNNKAVILVPKRFILDVPNISPEFFLNFIWEKKNKEIRSLFSYKIKSEINKKEIVEIARKRLDWVNEFEQFISKDLTLRSYDFKIDPRGVYQPAIGSYKYAATNPITLNATNRTEFQKCVDIIIQQYCHFIENENGYKLLWNDNGKPRREESAQITFTCVVKQFCKANNIDLSRENNLGRGPVDFKFSQGYKDRVSIEIKLAKNGNFWDGLNLQLPKYLEVEEIDKGYFIVICLTEQDLEKVKNLENVAIQISKQINKQVIPIIVDATPHKLSASKL
jgi:hypothetical protein